jgi:NADH-quinone oxidoreductase subunit H
VVYFGKVIFLVCFAMVVRWTLPRMRFDQVMMMGWQAVIPLSLAVVVMTSIMVYLGLTGLVPMLLANIVLGALLLAVYPVLPRYDPNRRIQLYGSRFSPVPGEVVSTRPIDAMALEDRPVQGTVGAL